MPTMTPVPQDHPLMIAWKEFQKTDEYENSVRWAKATKVSIDQSDMGREAAQLILDHPHLDGSLWALFMHGFESGQKAEHPVPTVAYAFEVVKAAMQADPDYAWSWHCNIAMSFYDELGPMVEPSAVRHEVCNRAAARFMRLCFDVDTSEVPTPKIPLSRAQKSIVVSNADGSESTGTRGEWVTGHYEVTHERPNRSEHWITDNAGTRHLVYGDTVRPTDTVEPQPNVPRNLLEVLDLMQREIPSGETELLSRLAAIRASVMFAAPEAMGGCWNRVLHVLQDEIGNPTGVAWKEKVESIFSGRAYPQANPEFWGKGLEELAEMQHRFNPPGSLATLVPNPVSDTAIRDCCLTPNEDSTQACGFKKDHAGRHGWEQPCGQVCSCKEVHRCIFEFAHECGHLFDCDPF